MTQGTNISLQINSGENLSYVIDKKLDNDLGVDVKLGLSEWNSVFNMIKNNLATKIQTSKTDVTLSYKKAHIKSQVMSGTKLLT